MKSTSIVCTTTSSSAATARLAAPSSISCSASRSPSSSSKPTKASTRELLTDKIPVIQGDAKRHDVLLQAGIDRARGICIVIDNDADNLYITVTSRSLNPKIKIITRAGQQRYANAIRSSGADEVIIPEYEGGLMTGRMIQKYYPIPLAIK
jgi:voltage-gated potassium channel Kch